MTSLFDASTDFIDVVDGLEAVTLVYAGGTSTSVASALRDAVEVMDRAGGRYTASDAVWSLPTSLVTTQPKLGGKIKDSSGAYWTILDVQFSPQLNVWECSSRNLAIVYGLDTYVDIQEATYTKDASGEEVPKYTTVVGGLHARVQPIDSEYSTDQQSRHVVKRVSITVAEPFELKAGMRVVGPDGTKYRIETMTSDGDIGSLPQITAVNDGWPET